MSYVLGISAFYHDSAAALLRDGIVVCAFQEERFTRIKQDKSFPEKAISACLKFAGIKPSQIETVCYYESPEKKFDRIIRTHRRNFPKGITTFVREFSKYIRNRKIDALLKQEFQARFGLSVGEIFYSDHHRSHAASAYYPSPFHSAAVLCVDGVGEWATVSAWKATGASLVPLWTIDFPHSLGLLYSAFTYFCGFKVDSGEYKLMGLAPYGTPRFVDAIEDNIISVQPDGNFTLNRAYFDYEVGSKMTTGAFDRLFGGPPRLPEAAITQREMDLAASVQVVVEKIILKLTARLRAETGETNLCLAGGVALNCVANGKIMKSGQFDHIFVQPASGDSGCALGAAYLGSYAKHDTAQKIHPAKFSGRDCMQGSLLGNSYSDAEICAELDRLGARYTLVNGPDELVEKTSAAIGENRVIGWFQGRMEFGPRALGARSILGNPMSDDMQKTMNIKIKNRESFRPFAPAVLSEHAHEWFDLTIESPYMLIVADLKKDKRLPVSEGKRRSGLDQVNEKRANIAAVVHVDYSSRVQSVDGRYNPLFRKLLEDYHKRTGCPILINTSFNVRGEPIVESPTNAYTCFMRTEMDCLVIGNLFLEKTDQPQWQESIDWRSHYELD